jgi:multidrug efflux pump subunit AcrB
LQQHAAISQVTKSAIVIAILTVIVGAITIALLPIAQFPNIAPPEMHREMVRG